MEFTLKLDRFEGPYTKLLELIESRKLSITEISLASVADEYIAYIKSLDQKNIVDISQFIVVASTLMLMKAKSLLPGVTYTEEEEKQVHDLEYKLELYTLLANASKGVASMFGKKPLYTRHHSYRTDGSVFVPDARVTGVLLQSVASLTLMSFVVPKVLANVAVEQALRIEHVIETLLERVKSAQASVSLQSVTSGVENKEEQKKLLIVNFIALLELLRTGSVKVEQHADGGDITVMSAQHEGEVVAPKVEAVTGESVATPVLPQEGSAEEVLAKEDEQTSSHEEATPQTNGEQTVMLQAAQPVETASTPQDNGDTSVVH